MKNTDLSLQTKNVMGYIKPKITPEGYDTTIRDYDEQTIIEELAANSYDAYASTFLLLLDETNRKLYVFDDGSGFSHSSMSQILTLGGSTKKDLLAKAGSRVYLGSYGFGFKSLKNIASDISIITCSEEENQCYSANIDLSKFDAMMADGVEGYHFDEKEKPKSNSKGTLITLTLKKSTSKKELNSFIKVLGNLPNENGKFNCYCGSYSGCAQVISDFKNQFIGLADTAKSLHAEEKVQLVSNLVESELEDCQKFDVSDKDNDATGVIYFAGMSGGKPKPLKDALRGIYIRIHGRLIKSDFSSARFTKNLTKYINFYSSTRTELSIDWLRDQINLSRTDIKFNNPQIEQLFKSILTKTLGHFCIKQFKKIETAKGKESDKKLKRRTELAKQRVSRAANIVIKDAKSGFVFKPTSDAELAILISQETIMNKIDPNYKLIDYNSQEPFDCMLYDTSRATFIHAELEPFLPNYLTHENKSDVNLLIVWSLADWKLTNARKKGKGGWFELVQGENSQKGHYKLLQYGSEVSRTFKEAIPVIVVNEIVK
ncbi:MAG: ATP-binding protein [Chitinophagaceae bacterium]